jgi:NTE family protein
MERALILSGGGARGAFQLGVLEYLAEKNWHPELICGTSVGAINAVAIGCGVTAHRLAGFWRALDRQKVYKFALAKFFLALLSRRRFSPVMDTTPLQHLLRNTLDIGMLRNSKTEIIISAVNMKTAEVTYFNQQTITLEHVMASSAMPMFFPWQIIHGEPYWDGGAMVNTPIAPAFARNAREIIVVLLSPIGGINQKLPRDHRHAAELIFEHLLVGSYHTLKSYLKETDPRIFSQKPAFPESSPAQHQREKSRIATVAPEQMLGFRSLLNFSVKQTQRLIHEGYLSACRQLRHFF